MLQIRHHDSREESIEAAREKTREKFEEREKDLDFARKIARRITNKDYVLIGNRLGGYPVSWMIYAGSKSGASDALEIRKKEFSSDEMRYSIISFKEYYRNTK